jgi:hypothetical protein
MLSSSQVQVLKLIQRQVLQNSEKDTQVRHQKTDSIACGLGLAAGFA